MATIETLLEYGKQQLENSGNEYAKYERKVLLEEVLGCNYMYMLMNASQEVDPRKEAQYKQFIARRVEHYPLQYILGVAHFMDYTFFVNEHVLIPRNDTEVLVETANDLLALLETRIEHPGILDLCCGSGCIGISLKLYHKNVNLVLSDVSEDALEVSKRNLQKYDLDADVVCGDLFEQVHGKVNVIVSNPPYIETPVIETLMPEVRDYEPMQALDGGEDGLYFYKKIVQNAKEHLEDQGYLLFEIGYNQGKAVQQLMIEQGFLDVSIKQDYAGMDRVVYGHL